MWRLLAMVRLMWLGPPSIGPARAVICPYSAASIRVRKRCRFFDLRMIAIEKTDFSLVDLWVQIMRRDLERKPSCRSALNL
jgi:hypothetical protein